MLKLEGANEQRWSCREAVSFATVSPMSLTGHEADWRVINQSLPQAVMLRRHGLK